MLLDTGSYPTYEDYECQTYTWTGSDWSLKVPLSTNIPARRTDTMMAYDTNGSVMVQFGGRSRPGTEYMNDVNTTTNAASWTNLVANYASTGPAIRARSMMAAMSSGAILFGGIDAHYYLYNDLWQFTSSAWTQLSTSGQPNVANPPIRYDAAFASDAAGGAGTTIVMFGGRNNSNLLGDTWKYTGSAWSQVSAVGSVPSYRSGAAMCWYQTGGYFLLFGGVDSSGQPLNDTYSFTVGSSTWAKLTPAFSPSVRTGAMLASDGSSNTILFGGRNSKYDLNDTYSWSGTNWTAK